MTSSGTVPPLVAGAVLGWASAHSLRRFGDRAVLGAGASLVGAALIYPAARRERASGGLAVEVAVVAATAALAAAARRADGPTGRRVVAAGWAAHALFDLAQGPSEDSRLPGWYAPLCAGFDVAYAARLAG